jgi:hypothetical protein
MLFKCFHKQFKKMLFSHQISFFNYPAIASNEEKD